MNKKVEYFNVDIEGYNIKIKVTVNDDGIYFTSVELFFMLGTMSRSKAIAIEKIRQLFIKVRNRSLNNLLKQHNIKEVI